MDKKRLGYWRERLMPPFLYPLDLKRWYKKCTGRRLNLKNPKTFSEKLQWLKLYYRNPKMSRYSDKYLVRKYVASQIGAEYLVPMLGLWNSFDEIDLDSLPNKFVLKATHGSKMNIIVEDKEHFDRADARKKMNQYLKTNFAFSFGYQLHYSPIRPRIIAEEYIENDGDLLDYKILAFHGKAAYIWIDSGRYTGHHRNIYDFDWKPAPFTIEFPKREEEFPRPENLEKMKELAERLAKGFPAVRVDFYNQNGKILFGELTFTTGSGQEKIVPYRYDRILGDMMKLP
ncbi:MAG: glycosyl transferase [Lachnospiraceae bacterium]|nr:glycosyl transferase [Lachnospiraceae bacterium]